MSGVLFILCSSTLHLCPVHTYPDIFEFATFSFRIQTFPRPHVAYSWRADSLKISGFAAEFAGRKPYPERKSCGFKNIRIRVERSVKLYNIKKRNMNGTLTQLNWKKHRLTGTQCPWALAGNEGGTLDKQWTDLFASDYLATVINNPK